jgi:hypothetical protein
MIKEFKGKYQWLSNFYPCSILYHGRMFRSVEHAYQSAKSDNTFWINFCLRTEDPGKVKTKSNNLEYDKELWKTKSLKVMERLLTQKFNMEPFRSLLLDTDNEELQEGNTWHDTFWGVDLKTGQGQNHLGKLIMLIRDRLLGKVW